MSDSYVKCACNALYTLNAFRELKLLGIRGYEDLGRVERLELRVCPCKSTVSQWIDKDGKPSCGGVK